MDALMLKGFWQHNIHSLEVFCIVFCWYPFKDICALNSLRVVWIMTQAWKEQAFQNGCLLCCADPNFQSPPMWDRVQTSLILRWMNLVTSYVGQSADFSNSEMNELYSSQMLMTQPHFPWFNPFLCFIWCWIEDNWPKETSLLYHKPNVDLTSH